MNKKLKRILVPLGTFAAATSVAAAISCGGDNKTKLNEKPKQNTNENAKEYKLTQNQYIENNSELLKNKTYVTLANGENNPSAYSTDASTKSGDRDTDKDLNLSNDNFLSPYILSNPNYKVTDESQTLIQPGTWYLKLGYASAVVLTVDGHEKIYDSDAYNQTNTVSSKDIVNGYVQFTSTESNSINNTQFLIDLANATDMKLQLRKGIKWVDSNGNVVTNESGEPYTVTAEDFLAGWERTQAFNISSVLENFGGTSDMNAAINASNNGKAIKSFSGKNNADNTYVYRLYGVNPDNFSDASKFITTTQDGTQYLNFPAFNLKNKPDYTLLLQNISSSYDFVPVPYEWIQYQNRSKGSGVLTAITETALPSMKTAYDALNKESLAYKLGIYWYGYDQTKILSSGPYYEPTYNAANYTQEYKLNTHYWDKNYVDNPLTIRTFLSKYSQSAQENSTYNTSVFNAVKTGTLSRAEYSELTPDQKNQVLKNQDLFYISYNNIIVNDSQTETIFFNMDPFNQSNDNISYESDAYTTLMFGTTKDNVLNNQAINPIKTATSAQALEFRTILESSIAWNQYVNQLRSNYGIASIPWLNPYAYDVPVNGVNSIKATTPRQNYYKLNNTFVVDSNGNKVVFDGITPADYNGQGTELSVFATNSLGSTSGNSLQSIVFSQLQTQMTKLLDNFYLANPKLNNEKMTVLIPTSYQYPDFYTNLLKNITKTWNKLDTKNRLDFQVKILGAKSNGKEFTNAIYNSTNPWKYSSWGYDYREINSGFDGLQLYGFNYIYFNEMVDPTYKSQLAKSFPILASIGDYLKEYMSRNNIQLRIRENSDYSQEENSLTQWITSQNGDYTAVLQKLLSLTQEQRQNAESELFVNTNQSLSLLTSEFWKSMSNVLTQEQMVKLMHETTMILTPFPDVIWKQNSFAITKGKATDPEQSTPTPAMPEGSVVFNSTITPSLYLQGYNIPYSFNNSWGIGYSNNLRLLPTKSSEAATQASKTNNN